MKEQRNTNRNEKPALRNSGHRGKAQCSRHAPLGLRRGGINWLALVTLAVSLAAAGTVLYALILRNAESEVRMGTQHDFVGAKPQPTNLENLDDKQKTSLIDLRGKLVLLVFWGTWDPSSREFASDWNELWESHRKHPRFAMMMVACESPSEAVGTAEDRFADGVRKFMKERGLTFPVWRDPEGLARSEFHMDRGEYPLTVLIGQEGYIRALWYGPVPGMQQDLERLVNRYLEEFGDS